MEPVLYRVVAAVLPGLTEGRTGTAVSLLTFFISMIHILYTVTYSIGLQDLLIG